MPILHEDFTDPEIHEPKGFAGAANSTALTKNATGALEFVLTSTIGGGDQGPVGPAGPSLAAWVTATGYFAGDTLYSAEADSTLNKIYRCTANHTSGASLLADIANWQELSESEFPTDAETKISYENNADTNAFDDAAQTKLAGIATGADVSDPILGVPLSTGLLTGCVLSINGGDNTKYDMTAGTGIHVDNTTTPGTPIITPVTMSAITGGTPLNIATETITFICFDNTGSLITTSTESSPADRRDLVVVGAVSHADNITIDSTFQNPNLPNDSAAQAQDIMQALGFFSTGGNQIVGVGGTMAVNKGAGAGFDRGRNHSVDPKNPHNFSMAALGPATLVQILQDATQVSISATIDPTQYDNAGVLTVVPGNNNATISYIYIFPGNQVVYLFGQEVFSTLSDAIAAAGTETVVVPPDLATGGLLLARVISRKAATDIGDANDSKIIASSAVSTGGGTITTMQQAYDAGSEPEITLTSTRGALSISDNATPIAAPLFEVQNSAASVQYLEVNTGSVRTETQAYSAENALVDAVTVATDCDNGNVHSVTLAGNRTLGAPTNLKAGATYLWIITQDGTGSRTLAYNSVFKFPGGSAPTLSTGIGAVDILSGVSDGTNVYCNLLGDFS